MERVRATSVLLFLLSLWSCRSPREPRSELTIAAAANLTSVFQRIGPRFEAETGIHPVFTFASTAQLTQQIENSAPFDLLAAADAAHVEQLDREHLLAPGSRAVYATGILALWMPPRSSAAIERIEDLVSPQVRIIAVANPTLAPYGQATVETLKHAGIWDAVQPKIAYAENINMARQYGTSRNADAVFTAYSLVVKDGGKIIRIDEHLHQPITQELGIVAKSHHQAAARRFAEYLISGTGHKMLLESGYR